MFIKKSEVAILVSSKENSFVRFLALYFSEKNLEPKVFESRNNLYLYLLTHKPETILVSRQIKSNNHKQVVNWIHNKYKIVTALFDEEVAGQEESSSVLDILSKSGPVASKKDSSESLNLSDIDFKKANKHFSLATEDIIATIDRKKGIWQHSTDSLKLKKLVESRLDLENKKSDKFYGKTQILPVDNNNFSGFLLLDSDEQNIVNKIAEELGLGNISASQSGYGVHNKIKKEFLGSYGGKYNTYAFDCQLPKLEMSECNGMLELDASYFIEENPVEFDVYIHMDHLDNDYHYLSPGSSFSISQIEKLKFNDKKVRVKACDKQKLVAYLNVSHMVKVSNEL